MLSRVGLIIVILISTTLVVEPGSGKTVIALALLAARPAPELDLIQKSIPFSDNRNRKMASRATLIVVPGHLIDQWHEEIDKCFKEKKNVIRIANNKDYNSTSWVSVIHADIVLLSKSFYLGSYINIIWDFRQVCQISMNV
jgi:superfamily II DNA or RNA helicase